MAKANRKAMLSSTEFSSENVENWLRNCTIEDLFMVYRGLSSYLFRSFNVSVELLDEIESRLPRMSELVDFGFVKKRLSMQKTKNSPSESISLSVIMPELVDVRDLSHAAITKLSCDGIKKAEALLQAVTEFECTHANLEAAIYLSSRGKRDRVNSSKIEEEWRNDVYYSIESGKCPGPPLPYSVMKKVKSKTLALGEAADVLRLGEWVFPFWMGYDKEEPFLTSTMLRAADWLAIGGFDDWWKSAVTDLSSGPKDGLLILPASVYLFHCFRSDLLIRMTERIGLDAYLWALMNGDVVREKPWRVFWNGGRENRVRESIIVAATIVFGWYRLLPTSLSQSILLSCLELIMSSECSDGGWPWWSDDPSAEIVATCVAIHAIALSRPLGWKMLAGRGADWLTRIFHPQF